MAKKEIFLKDYKEPDFWIKNTELDFTIEPLKTIVKSKLTIERNGDHSRDLVLDGVDLKPLGLFLDGKALELGEYQVDGEKLRVKTTKSSFTFESTVEIDPKNNFSCEGLYQSGDIFCTQNEAEGFRKITYFMDRPDVMSSFTTTLRADKDDFPTLLANGNKVKEGKDSNGKRFVVWRDPFPKPCYLFAVVAGDLAVVSDEFTTMSKKKVRLEIYVDKGNEDKCDHAMISLKNAMKWDEEKYGLEYDLDIYMVVAVDSFNMGAMENKGLNIFNSAYVLAKRETATDANFQGIEGVIGHEYFHNWTGNRVTCRDWFQLTLKEGLTVFRDQEFSSDMLSRPVKRIDDVIRLKRHQFPEDQGPMSHPIRPKSYIEINNFYTATVYEKGAEIIRMIHTLLGEQGFRKGMDLYFERFDGEAVTTDDFIEAMADANDKNLAQFKMWYEQKGTPKLKVDENWDEANKTLELTFIQDVKIDSDKFDALYMPFHIGLFLNDGTEVEANTKLVLREKTQTFKFENLEERPIVSLNRGFSAPVIIEKDYSDSEFAVLMGAESDEFARYDAAQNLYKNTLKKMSQALAAGQELEPSAEFFHAYEALLDDDKIERAYLAYALALPTEAELDEDNPVYLFGPVHQARKNLKKLIAIRFQAKFQKIYNDLEQNEFSLSASAMGERSLRQVCLKYLGAIGDKNGFEAASQQYKNATNMTEEFSALSCLYNNYPGDSESFIQTFYNKWENETLVMQKWFALQAASENITIEKLKELENSPAYNKKVPNLLRSLVGAFAMGNRLGLNDVSGDGYAYIADKIIEIDGYNPQVASRIAKALNHLKRLDEKRKELLSAQLERILSKDLSNDTYEVVYKILKGQ